MNNEVDSTLHNACVLYNRGKFKKCFALLKQVSFPVFDIREWNLENNILLCETKINNQTANLTDKFRALMEKVRGLPPDTQTLLTELSIALNYSFVLLAGDTTNRNIDGAYQAGVVLTNSILRACQAFGLAAGLTVHKNISTLQVFQPHILENSVQSVEVLLERTANTNSFDLITLSCWMLAVLWISQHQMDAALSLLEVLQKHTDTTQDVSSVHQRTILVDTLHAKSVFPFCLIPSTDEAGLSTVKSLVCFLTSLCYKYYKYDNATAMDVLTTPITSISSTMAFYIDYLKGLILYDSDDVDKACKCFTHCVSNVTDMMHSNKAAALTMVGCWLSKKGRCHTAIAKLKEALRSDFNHHDALFYTALEYQKLGKDVAEIQSLKYLCKALRTEGGDTSCRLQSLLRGHTEAFYKNLIGRSTTLPYATYWLAKRCLFLGRYEESSNAYLDVIAEVRHNPHVQLSAPPYVLPSLLLLYRDCAFALLKAGKSQDCVMVCNSVFEDVQSEDDTFNLWESKEITSTRKRQRQTTDFIDQTCGLEIVLCKANAMLQMNQVLESLECLQRVFDTLENISLRFDEAKTTGDTQHSKRIKLEQDTRIQDADTPNTDSKGNEQNKKTLLKIKSEAHLIRASVLQAVDKEKDSLEELNQSYVCNEDNVAAVYRYTGLLFKLGPKRIAASNWLKFSGMRKSNLNVPQNNVKTSHHCTDLPFFFDVTNEELQAMDELASKHS